MELIFLILFLLGILDGGVYMLMSIGISLLFGVMKIVNFAQGTIVLLGAYILYTLESQFKINPLVFMPASILVGTIVGYVLYLFSITPLIKRKDFENQTMLVTFAAFLVLQNMILLIWGPAPQAIVSIFSVTGLHLFGHVFLPESYFITFIATLVGLLLLYFVLFKTNFGRAVRAISQDVSGAMLMGININSTYMLSFALATALAGAGGAMVGLVYSFDPNFGFTLLLISFGIVAVGGLGNLKGTAIASIIIGIVQSFTQYYAITYTNGVIYATILLAILIRGRLTH